MNRESSLKYMHATRLTRSESAMSDRKSMITLLSNSSYAGEDYAKVYRIAEMTVALAAGDSSRIRSYCRFSTQNVACGQKTYMQLRKVS